MTALQPKQTMRLVVKSVEDDDGGQQTATVVVRWFPTPTLIQQIRDRAFEKPHILLVTRSVTRDRKLGHDRTTYRDTDVTILPLQKALTYLSFARAGENEVHALVVNVGSSSDASRLGKIEKKAGTGQYPSYHDTAPDTAYIDTDQSVLDAYGEPKAGAFSGLHKSPLWTHTRQIVDVPREMFAPEPPAWQKRVVRAFFPSSEHDQCHFWRRLFISSGLSVVCVPTVFVLKMLSLTAAVFMAKRHIPLQRTINPLDLSPFCPYKDAGPSYWYYHRPQSQWSVPTRRALPIQLLSPPILVIAPLVMWAGWNIWGSLSLARAYLYLIGALVGLLIGVCALFLVLQLLGQLFEGKYRVAIRRLYRWCKKISSDAWANYQQRRINKLQRELDALMLTDGIVPQDADMMPPSGRLTLRLRVAAHKAGHCKPVAKP